ncbi:cation diffusion facilitator family transporter [Labrys monachus]|uniref:Cation diffusion facilitator family transporter n=1 Tax=Labrys monachus TaxID=217067 RepID=A0ABU0F6T5_9HYPH|nr:cation diffusion facilitator family transporter [Labrys monachus]MDQ0390319.1 cation diffusion facilitator family transporter [Labrys monachus]
MPANILDRLGFGGQDHGHSHGGHGHDHGAGGHGHTHGVVDPSIATTAKGIWAIKWSFVILAITAILQLIVVFTSGSVALLADTIHNVGDATTAIPLWIAFVLVRRPPTKVFNYGLGRVEDLAGLLIVLIILFSAVIAGYEAIDRLIHPQAITQLGWVAAAGIIGFLGNEIVAVFRIRVGREIESTALIADGYHARTDGLTSLAVVLGAAGVWAGFPLADPIIGLLITIAIFGIVWQSARAVITRALDGVEPSLADEIHHAGEHVPGVKIVDARARWLGHRLHADVAIAVNDSLPVSEATRLADRLRGELMGHMPALRTATITFAAPDDANIFEVLPHAHGHDHGHGHHHAPEPFIVDGELAKGQLAIVDTPAGERFRLVVASHADGLEAVVVINRPDGRETLPLEAAAGDHHTLESTLAPAEPHEFTAELHLAVPGRQETLHFEMKEPEGHHHS